MKIKMPKKTRAATPAPASNAKLRNRNLPPDTDGLFKRAAARGKKVITMYKNLNPEAEGNLVSNLLHDLMHRCDRDPKLGDFHDEHGFAVGMYQEFVAENMWALGWYDDLEAAQEAAEQMMLSDVK